MRNKEFFIFDYISDNNYKMFLEYFQQKAGENITDVESVKNYLRMARYDTVSVPHIFIGTGTCGLGAGAKKVLEIVQTYLQKEKINAKVVEVGCIGLCYAEPIMDIKLPGFNRISFGKVTPEKVVNILNQISNYEIVSDNVIYQFEQNSQKQWPNIPTFSNHEFIQKQTRKVLANCGKISPINIIDYIANSGYCALLDVLNSKRPLDVCDIVEQSGLRGRGGGGYLTGKKWKFCYQSDNKQRYLICNADEGDPGAFMDRAIIEGDPHKLLEGIIISAYAIKANKAYVYIRAEYPLAIKNLELAIEQAKKWGFIGKNILGCGYNLEVIIKKGAGAFVCGEETALINSIEGKRGMPRPRPPYPAVKGLHDCPTIINNVETLANIPEILLTGSEQFRSLGVEGSFGTKVFAVSGKIKRPGLVEVAMGTTIKDIIFSIGGGIKDDKLFKAVQIGGPSGGCLTQDHLDISVDYESLKQVGAMMGSGGLVVMDETNCMVDVALFFMDFIQRESCGKCIPCREGTKRMLKVLQSITNSYKSEEGLDALDRFNGILQLEKLASVIKETSLCGLGQTAPNPVLSTLRWFRDEYESHIFDRICPAGVCEDLLIYKIDSDQCKGCGLCLKKCPNKAIEGKPKETHYIILENCVKCGLCLNICPFNAIDKSNNAGLEISK